MANEIRTEFETYVQQLAETICKEIYLEDLKRVCDTYTEQLEVCRTLYEECTETNRELQQKNGESLEQITSISTMLGEKIQSIEKEMVSFEEKCQSIIKEHSTEIYAINNELREEFLARFSEAINSHKEELTQEMDLCNENIKKSLEASLTEEGIEKFVAQMRASTDKISAGLELLHGGYQEVFEQYSARIEEYGTREQENFQNIMENMTREGIGYFKEALDKSIDEQKHILEDKMVSSDDVEILRNEIAKMSQNMQSMQKSYEEKLSLITKILYKDEKAKLRMEKERKIEKKYLFCLVVVNIILLFFTGITLLASTPWEVLGAIPTTVALVVLIIIVLYMVCFRSKKALPSGEIKGAKDKKESGKK